MATCDMCLIQSVGRGMVNQTELYFCTNHYIAYNTSIYGWEYTSLGRDI